MFQSKMFFYFCTNVINKYYLNMICDVENDIDKDKKEQHEI